MSGRPLFGRMSPRDRKPAPAARPPTRKEPAVRTSLAALALLLSLPAASPAELLTYRFTGTSFDQQTPVTGGFSYDTAVAPSLPATPSPPTGGPPPCSSRR